MRKALPPVSARCIHVRLWYLPNDVQYCQRHGAYIKYCAECGQPFHTERVHTNTCSDLCRKRFSRRDIARRSESKKELQK